MTREATAQQLLRAHLAAGAPERERFIARLFVVLTLGAFVVVLAVNPPGDRGLVLRNSTYQLPALVYHVALLLALRRGWYHAALPWIGAAMQTSMLAVPYYFLLGERGTLFSAMPIGWISLVSVSALRANPMISVAAGLLGGAEYVAIVLSAPVALTSSQASEVYMTGAFFVLAGLVAAGIAMYLIRQAQDALRAVREQDLMGKYFMHERLGAGGMAEVFRATYSPEGGFEKIVAVKRVLPKVAAAGDGDLFLTMFREEAALCARLSHPNVIQVLDAGKFRDTYVLTMEYVDGLPLQRAMERTTQPLAMCAITYVGAELASALEYIHTRRDTAGAPLHLVHRDVNPPNILVSRLGEVKLADFGVAHAVNRASLVPDRVYGKPGYLAPEQVGEGEIDGRADLFALGLTLYELVAGKPLFRGNSMFEVLDFRMPDAELSAMPRARELPDDLRRLIVDLLAPRPEDRPRSGAAVRERLLAITGAAAPYPNGQAELARVVQAAREAPEATASPATAATVRA